MALKKIVERLTKSVEDRDREQLVAWNADRECTPIDEVVPRCPVRVAGEVRSVRIVPRAGADGLEVTVHDGHANVTAIFLGRRKIQGISPGRRLALEGVAALDGRRLLIYNPLYTLL